MNTQNVNKHIELRISTSKGPFVGVFEVTTKVSEVIATVCDKVGLSPADHFELWFGDKRLEPEERTLESFHLPNLANLKLVATGEGV